MGVKLKPCPFCGSTDIYETHSEENYYTGQEFRAITIEDLEEEPSVLEQA